MNSDNSILYFFGWWQFTTCFFAFLGLISIWYHLGRKQKDTGQVWLAVSILCWSFSGLTEVLFANQIQHSQIATLRVNGLKSILSLFNSLFILLALPWFRHLPPIVKNLIQSKYWLVIIGLPFLFSLLPTLSALTRNTSTQLISEADVYYSTLTLILLGLVLWESFSKRRLKLLALLSIVCIAITFIAQLYKLSNLEINQVLLAAIFKTCLIMLFFALALSWVKDLSEAIKANPFQLNLKLHKEKIEGDKYLNVVKFQHLFPENKDLILSNTQFELLSKFASIRKQSKEGWLEIKPKNSKNHNKSYDINDYNEIKRVLQSLLDSYYGKGSWNKDQHEKPLKEILFERSPTRERKIRLKLKPENIQLNQTSH